MNEHRLAGIEARLDRAEEHLDFVERELPAWFAKEKPHTAVHDSNERKRTWVIRLKIDTPIPPLFGIIIGEAVHNMRSTLDHLVHELIESEGGNPTRATAWPVAHTTAMWRRKVERRKFRFFRQKGGGPLRSLDPRGDAWALVQRHQPYHCGKQAKEHPVFVLEDLWNRDKHRTINPFLMESAMDGSEIQGCLTWNPPIEPLSIHSPVKRGDYLVEGTTLCVIRFPLDGPFPIVQMKHPLRVQPAFGDGEAGGRFVDSLDRVREIVTEAKPIIEANRTR